MQLRIIFAEFAFLTVFAVAALAGDETDSNKKEETLKPLVGIGTSIRLPPIKDGMQLIEQGGEISQLLPNSPAALCGELAVGDLIVAVGQGDEEPKNCRGMAFSEVINLIRGPRGTEVRLTVIPADHLFVKQKVVALIREPLQGGKLVGKKAPNVALTGLADGGERQLSDFLGKVVVLEFWTSTCAPCIICVNAMQTFSEKHPAWGDRVALIALSVDEKREAASDLLGRKDWPRTYNAWGDERVRRAFDADLLPLVVIIDTDGNIVAAGDPRIVNVSKFVDGLLGLK